MSLKVAGFQMIYFGMGYLVIKQQMLCHTSTGRAVSFWKPVTNLQEYLHTLNIACMARFISTVLQLFSKLQSI